MCTMNQSLYALYEAGRITEETALEMSPKQNEMAQMAAWTCLTPHRSDPAAAGSVASGFKGIALFTPGGDCVYCMDQQKQVHWHIDLCTGLQKQLGLIEPPYFLLPCFTATIDQWFDADQQQLVTIAEAYPRAMPFQSFVECLVQSTGSAVAALTTPFILNVHQV